MKKLAALMLVSCMAFTGCAGSNENPEQTLEQAYSEAAETKVSSLEESKAEVSTAHDSAETRTETSTSEKSAQTQEESKSKEERKSSAEETQEASKQKEKASTKQSDSTKQESSAAKKEETASKSTEKEESTQPTSVSVETKADTETNTESSKALENNSSGESEAADVSNAPSFEDISSEQASEDSQTEETPVENNAEDIQPAQHTHTYVTQVLSEATCTEPKKLQEVCSVCGAAGAITTEGEALGHDWGEDWYWKEATCNSPGQLAHTCKRCEGIEMFKFTPLAEHTYGDPIVLVEGDCMSEHIEKHICTVCGHEEETTDNRHANDHVWVTGTYEEWDDDAFAMVEKSRTFCQRCNRDKE